MIGIANFPTIKKKRNPVNLTSPRSSQLGNQRTLLSQGTCKA